MAMDGGPIEVDLVDYRESLVAPDVAVGRRVAGRPLAAWTPSPCSAVRVVETSRLGAAVGALLVARRARSYVAGVRRSSTRPRCCRASTGSATRCATSTTSARAGRASSTSRSSTCGARPRRCAARRSRCRPRCASRRCAAGGASCTCAGPSSSPGWSTAATSPSRCGSTTAPGAPTSSSTWSAAARWWSTPRCRSTPTSTRRRRRRRVAARGHLARHARQLRTHVDLLVGKAYWRALPRRRSSWCCSCPPSRSWPPPRGRPGLLEHAAARQVVLATPTTLIALLRTVAHGWSHEALADQAREIHRLGRELHGRWHARRHLDSVGRSLNAPSATTTPPWAPRVAGAGHRAPVRRPRGHRRRPGHARARSSCARSSGAAPTTSPAAAVPWRGERGSHPLGGGSRTGSPGGGPRARARPHRGRPRRRHRRPRSASSSTSPSSLRLRRPGAAGPARGLLHRRRAAAADHAGGLRAARRSAGRAPSRDRDDGVRPGGGLRPVAPRGRPRRRLRPLPGLPRGPRPVRCRR